MIITLEHEDIEAALISWMNDKGMAASIETTSIRTSKARSTGRLTAVIDPNGKVSTADINTPEKVEEGETENTEDGVNVPSLKLFS